MKNRSILSLFLCVVMALGMSHTTDARRFSGGSASHAIAEKSHGLVQHHETSHSMSHGTPEKSHDVEQPYSSKFQSKTSVQSRRTSSPKSSSTKRNNFSANHPNAGNAARNAAYSERTRTSKSNPRSFNGSVSRNPRSFNVSANGSRAGMYGAEDAGLVAGAMGAGLATSAIESTALEMSLAHSTPKNSSLPVVVEQTSTPTLTNLDRKPSVIEKSTPTLTNLARKPSVIGGVAAIGVTGHEVNTMNAINAQNTAILEEDVAAINTAIAEEEMAVLNNAMANQALIAADNAMIGSEMTASD